MPEICRAKIVSNEKLSKAKEMSFFSSSSGSDSDSSGSGKVVAVVCSVVVIQVGIACAIFVCMKKLRAKEKLVGHGVVNAPVLQMATMERFIVDMAKEKPTRFSGQELAACTHNFSKILGSGGFGVVYEGEFPNGIRVAVKVLKNIASKRVEEQFMAEVSTMSRTSHINLVRLYGFCFDETIKALVYEYMPKGSLDGLLFNHQGATLQWDKLNEISIGIARGLAYLHEECHQRIIHYDIKPENVLLDANLNPKVADFGLARLCNRDNTHITMSGFKGTLGYAAPELWTPYSVTHKCDVYSFGMVLFEIVGRRKNYDILLSGSSQEWLPRWAYEKFNHNELFQMFSILGIGEEEREKAERMVKVALWCVQYLPNARPMMSSVVKMLEGGVVIDPPPNPFAHLEDNLVLNTIGYSDSSYSNSSNSLLKSNQNNKLEIQIASS